MCPFLPLGVFSHWQLRADFGILSNYVWLFCTTSSIASAGLVPSALRLHICLCQSLRDLQYVGYKESSLFSVLDDVTVVNCGIS